jgi:hypothetical protein
MGAKSIDTYSLNNDSLDAVFYGGSVERKLDYGKYFTSFLTQVLSILT